MDIPIEYEEDWLAHHGVLGMKWGVRNAETQRKYAGGKGTAKKKVQAAKKKVTSTAHDVKNMRKPTKKELKVDLQAAKKAVVSPETAKKVAAAIGGNLAWMGVGAALGVTGGITGAVVAATLLQSAGTSVLTSVGQATLDVGQDRVHTILAENRR